MIARIFRPAKTAMQSGQGKSQDWRLVFEPEAARVIEPLMGYTGSSDMRQQVTLVFATRDEAVAYAEKNGLAYQVFEAEEPKRRIAAYSDNFKFNRIGAWTH